MKGKKRFDFSLSSVAIIAILSSIVLPTSTYAADENGEDFSLTIMHMNDTHARVEPLANMVTAVKEVRAQKPDALLFNAGDVFSGTLYFNQFQGQADLALLNMMDIDAMTFGNHEFDLGSSENGHASLSEFITGANFPFVSANVDLSADPFTGSRVSNTFTEDAQDSTVYDGMVKEVNGEKIGIFGLTTEETLMTSSPVAAKITNYKAEAERAVAAFEDMGIDKIVAISHLGYDSNPAVGNDLMLAEQVDGIDVIVGGHSHTQLNEPTVVTTDENGASKDPTVIVQAYQYAQYLGELDVNFNEQGVVTGSSGHLIDATQKQADPEAVNILNTYKSEVDQVSNQETGAVAQKPLTNPRLTDSDVSVRANETELGNLITDAMLVKAQEKMPEVSIAMQNGGGIRAAIDQGPITVGEVITVLPFGNDPAVVQLTGEEIKQILEYSVRLAPEESGGFLQVSGMKFAYDSTKEAGSRVVSMQVKNGEEYVDINSNQTYLVTTNNFTAKGGDGFEVFAQAYADGRVQDLGEIDWEQFRDYMVEDLNGVVDPVIEGRITDLLGKDLEQTEPPVEEDPEAPVKPDPNEETPDPNGDGNDQGEHPGDKPQEDPKDDNKPVDEDKNNQDDKDSTPPPSSQNNGGNGSNSGGSILKVSDDKTSPANSGSKLPNTATNMYTYMLAGVVLLAAGVVTFIFKRKKAKA
ncbi:bifunctional metallophosphatase/5'-nucleotidase [Terribacillus saccharophilus]|uniref:Bifunctional metallophosphatase/5'-nucleotidase n=1 Tax=Terribacillus saccharophilus TaxID=361277 RepID=A0A268A934_9BACI|nr:5'-nucleotidase C-terminal domain-containing protein [Terribacillus saccharophilus]PAD20623.1 bifunctional metallophosphatase/5'-nucleotidase [Terribacillus saccharophilus]